MLTKNISYKKFKELKKLELDKSIVGKEGTLFFVDDKDKWDRNQKLVKRFYNTSGPTFSNKLYTINSLINQKENIDIDELVMPEKLVVSNSEIIGYTMDYIDGTNLGLLLKNPKLDREQAINYLKQIGIILEKISKLNEYGIVNNFYLNDVHEGNFVVNKEGIVRVVDMDSCRIDDNNPFIAKYLCPFSQVDLYPEKYSQKAAKGSGGYIMPDKNSDLYCYNIMILNYLYQDNITKLDIPELYEYLNYLISIGFPYELVDSFNKLFENTDNINPYELLDLIPCDKGRAIKKVYELRK